MLTKGVAILATPSHPCDDLVHSHSMIRQELTPAPLHPEFRSSPAPNQEPNQKAAQAPFPQKSYLAIYRAPNSAVPSFRQPQSTQSELMTLNRG